VLLAAVAKADRRVIGTIRLATNVEAQLPVEQSVELPSELTRTPLGEFGRFATARDQPDPMIAMMLMKAAYLVAASMQVRTLVVASRQAMAARYEALGFRDLVPDAWYPLAHVGGLPHRLLTLDLVGIVERYRAMNHPMWAFVYQIDHPDICLLAHSEQYRRGA
jgi:hypothetical protein